MVNQNTIDTLKQEIEVQRTKALDASEQKGYHKQAAAEAEARRLSASDYVLSLQVAIEAITKYTEEIPW